MTMPSQTSEDLSFFDRFATGSDKWTSKAWFFLASCLMVVVWIPTYLFVPDVDTWQLLINTPTTVITFLLVALQANTHKRSDAAMQTKLNAIADGLAHSLESDEECEDCAHEAQELREAVGLEDKESS